MNKCPICNNFYTGAGTVSQRDHKTVICSKCALNEAKGIVFKTCSTCANNVSDSADGCKALNKKIKENCFAWGDKEMVAKRIHAIEHYQQKGADLNECG